ncbi:MAG: hypothetical protein KGL29_04470 [Alphaproteobacteria bacterium]|nr:hypothetical protein [Alphaproteobacteria bacterium]MDE2163880.1 hypothetical protein [Alphaproteobacteria bacterium]MDE2265130.1 hypothetical protein [Alphaproteobacteria bacterium]MDE2500526.1 hypothetical protein [Alphaproteobacteria bacterium]
MTRLSCALFCAALYVAAMPVHAQTRYKVMTMDFDIWCTEEQHLPYQRCEKRLPDDVKTFEAYRDTVERYEIPYLQEKDDRLRFDRDIMHNDPIDNPPQPNVPKPNAPAGGSP